MNCQSNTAFDELLWLLIVSLSPSPSLACVWCEHFWMFSFWSEIHKCKNSYSNLHCPFLFSFLFIFSSSLFSSRMTQPFRASEEWRENVKIKEKEKEMEEGGGEEKIYDYDFTGRSPALGALCLDCVLDARQEMKEWLSRLVSIIITIKLDPVSESEKACSIVRAEPKGGEAGEAEQKALQKSLMGRL